MIEKEPELKEKIHIDFPFIKAEVKYVCEYEMAESLRDFFARRTRWEILNWDACLASLDTVANLMSATLHWSDERKNKEINDYKAILEKFKKSTTQN